MSFQAWIEDHGRNFRSFINGNRVDGDNTGKRNVNVTNPCTGDVLGCVLEAGDQDIEAAVNAKVFDAWRKLSGHIRAKHLYR